MVICRQEENIIPLFTAVVEKLWRGQATSLEPEIARISRSQAVTLEFESCLKAAYLDADVPAAGLPAQL